MINGRERIMEWEIWMVIVDVGDVSALRRHTRIAQAAPESETGTGCLETEAEHIVGTVTNRDSIVYVL